MKVAIFDLDGTLADTVASLAYAGNKALEECGLAALPVERYNYFAGDGPKVLVQRALKEAGDLNLVYEQQVYEGYHKHLEEGCMYQVTIFDGLHETLNQMKEAGIRLGVLTNKPHDRAIDVVETLFGKGYFDAILGIQPGVPTKPSIEGATRLLNELGAVPEECLYVGDTNVDMQTGTRAGMYTIGVTWGFRQREELEAHGADAIIERPEELLGFL